MSSIEHSVSLRTRKGTVEFRVTSEPGDYVRLLFDGEVHFEIDPDDLPALLVVLTKANDLRTDAGGAVTADISVRRKAPQFSVGQWLGNDAYQNQNMGGGRGGK
jgi:hypothetical protein